MNVPDIEPPRLVLRFFRWFCNPDCRDDIEGDLTEIFQRNAETKGSGKARWLFVINVLKLLRPGIIRPLTGKAHFNNYGMFRNYLYTAFRNMKREKLFALMNITGLAIGIGCGLVIYKIITYEMSFDAYHKNYKNIYRLITEFNHPQYGTGYGEGQVHPLGEALRNDFPGVDAVMTYYAGEGQVTVIDAKGDPDRYHEYKGIAYAEPNLFRVFDFNFLAGDPDKALVNKGSVVITAGLAMKYFKLPANEVSSAIGKTITINNAATLQVTAIIANTPSTTDLPFTLIGNYKDQPASNPYFNDGVDWGEYNSNTNCYMAVSEGMPAERLQRMLPEFLVKYSGKERAAFAKYLLQPLSELHYDSRVPNYNKRQISYSMLSILGVIGLFLVVSACINFVNMSTAQAVKRAKEIGVRKSLGVRKGQLIRQFLGETVFISLLASVGGIMIAQMLFMLLEGILGYQLNVEIFNNLNELLFLLSLVIATGLLSGFYPAIVMAGLNPIRALKNSLSAGSTSGLLSLRRSLVVLQFVISQVLIIGTIVASQQMNYFLGNDVGFVKEAVLVSKVPGSAPEKRDALKNILLRQPGVEMVTFTSSSPMARFRVSNEIEHPSIGKDDRVDGNLKTADENYIELFHLKLIAGKNLPEEKNTYDVVINRKLTRTLGYETPEQALGDKFKYSDNMEFKIIGVVEDFHSTSFHNPMENVILSNLPWNIFEMAVKINTTSGNFSEAQNTIAGIKTEWDKMFPETIFDYTFLDQQIAQMYETEKKTSQLFQIFSTVAIFIGCLGLYGLVSYMANQKTKEIGIRKVMGASVANIFGIFSKEMLVLLAIAFLLAAPVAWYVMKSWLQGFKYQVALSPMFFAAALLISVVIAFVTIGFKAISASNANPIDSLRRE
ncbi:MAG TPA: FtsX-like permease family protein [Cyclobacteriaceae bacterium]|nr:FtsX-like permease family protein [Cyclobacteriaceae bacterium]